MTCTIKHCHRTALTGLPVCRHHWHDESTLDESLTALERTVERIATELETPLGKETL